MAWPELRDFQIAIQNPSICFDDAELKSGNVVCDSTGMPKPASGQFATAYEVVSGAERWAVRTFNREVTDHQQRYQLISSHLAAVMPSYMVDFQYLPQGILAKGGWYPIVRMEWAEGIGLTGWVRQNLRDPGALLDLARRWRGMVGSLYGLHVAHADLHQENVRVTPDGELKLIDYDGMYVPAMSGRKAPELGNPDWNHPGRTPDIFGPCLDQFPGLVGYLSLLAMAFHPDLFDRFYNYNNLILSRNDFVEPARSECVQLLKRSSQSSIKELAARLAEWCGRSIDGYTLEDVAGGIAPPVARPKSPRPVTTPGKAPPKPAPPRPAGGPVSVSAPKAGPTKTGSGVTSPAKPPPVTAPRTVALVCRSCGTHHAGAADYCEKCDRPLGPTRMCRNTRCRASTEALNVASPAHPWCRLCGERL
ncbi:MAG TPA: hypothetical protein VM537_02175 [Anaerolineae bacterium]|nr:hypothetical protein [Anaerolineae bacterium]